MDSPMCIAPDVRWGPRGREQNKRGGNSHLLWSTQEASRPKRQEVLRTSTNASTKLLAHSSTRLRELMIFPKESLLHTSTSWKQCGYVTHSLLATERHTHADAEYHKDAFFSMTLSALMVRPWIIQVQKKRSDTKSACGRPSPRCGWRETPRELPGSHQRHPHHHSWRTNRS